MLHHRCCTCDATSPAPPLQCSSSLFFIRFYLHLKKILFWAMNKIRNKFTIPSGNCRQNSEKFCLPSCSQKEFCFTINGHIQCRCLDGSFRLSRLTRRKYTCSMPQSYSQTWQINKFDAKTQRYDVGIVLWCLLNFFLNLVEFKLKIQIN